MGFSSGSIFLFHIRFWEKVLISPKLKNPWKQRGRPLSRHASYHFTPWRDDLWLTERTNPRSSERHPSQNPFFLWVRISWVCWSLRTSSFLDIIFEVELRSSSRDKTHETNSHSLNTRTPSMLGFSPFSRLKWRVSEADEELPNVFGPDVD